MDGLDLDADRRQVAPEYGNVAEKTARSWAYVLEEIPTKHLEECIAVALRAKKDDWQLTTGGVLKAYDDLLPLFAQRARDAQLQAEVLMLPAGEVVRNKTVASALLEGLQKVRVRKLTEK